MKSIKRLGLILIILIAALFIKFNEDLLFANPVSSSFGDFVYATVDSLGNRIIIDSSGQRLSKISPDSKLVFMLKGKKSSRGFYEAKKAVTDKDNNIYVLSIQKEDGSYRIRKEEIIKFSPKGKYIGLVCAVEHEEPVLVEKIMGLYNIDGALSYIINEDNSFTVYNEENNVLASYESPDTRLMTASYAIHPKTKEVYYSSKKGMIYKYKPEGEDELIYDANESDYLSIPRDLSFDAQGNLYFTDIGLRTVSMITPDKEIEHVIYEDEIGEDLADKYIYYFCNATNGIITVTSDYMATVDDGEILAEDQWGYSSGVLLRVLAVWLAVVVLAVIIVFLLVRGALFLIFKGPKIIKLAAGVIIGVICISGIFLLIILPNFQERLLNSLLQRAQVISDVTVMQLPIEKFKSLDSTADFMNDDYIAVRESIGKLFLSDNENISDFYCMLYTVQDNIITCSYSLQEDSGAIYPYDWTYEESDEQWIMENKEGIAYKGVATSEGSYLFVLNPILDESGEAVGLIEVGTDLNSYNKETSRMVLELLLNIIVISIVVVLVAWEIIIFMNGRNEYNRLRRSEQDATGIQLPNDLMRILVFGIFFITNMTTSFLPIHAMNIAESSSIAYIPKEIMAAIPISAEVLFGAIFSVMGNKLIYALGNKKSAVFGSILFSLGLFVRFIVPNIWLLTLGNAIMGSGWGILLLIVNTVIASGSDDDKNKGFAGYSAAALNGVNCGIVFGGFLINWLDHTSIFLLAAIISLFVLVHIIRYLNKANYNMISNNADNNENRIGFIKFFTGKGVIGFFIMIVIPVISCGYFLNYMFPILGNQYGLSETNIGYAYLINGLCVICFSNFLTTKLTKKLNKAYSLVLSSLLYAGAFVLVAYFQNVYALLAVLVLLGISDSFGLPVQTSYFTDLDAVKQYGYEKSMGIYSLFENISQTGGSYIFSCVLLAGVQAGLYIVVAVIVALALLFGLMYLINSRRQAAASKAM